MSARFTPGPWASFQFGSSATPDEIGLGVCVAGKSLQVMMGEEESMICLLTDPNARADANLIAAAPELYAALVEVLGEFVDPQQGIEQFKSAIVRKAVESAQRVLRKARGEQVPA